MELEYFQALMQSLGYPEHAQVLLVRFLDLLRPNPFAFINILVHGKDLICSWLNDEKTNEKTLVITVFDDNFINIAIGDKKGELLENVTYDISGGKVTSMIPSPMKLERYDLGLFRLFLGSIKHRSESNEK